MLLIFAGSTDVLSADHTSRFLVPFLLWIDPHISWATIAQIHLGMRKLGHLTEYAILAVLLWRALRATLSAGSWRTSALSVGVIALTMSAVFAVSDEFHQSFIPSRTPSENDVLIDICGAAIALGLCWMFAGRRRAVEPLPEATP